MGQAGRLKPPISNTDLRADVALDGQSLALEMQPSTYASKWLRWAAFLVIAFLGLLLRLPQLGERPMHTDEAVNAYIIGQLLADRPFIYDPQDRHGPALAALALPLARMQGARKFSDLTESELRVAPVLAGCVTILLFGAAVELFGFVPCLTAALLFAAAPLPVYYDRYFIHESVFAAAAFGLILTGWRALDRRSAALAALAGACAALMLATKETAVLHLFALSGAAFVFWHRNARGKASSGLLWLKTALAAGVAFLLLSVTLFTWFGSNWNALAQLLQVAPHVLARAGGEGHQQPFWYYARLLSGGWSGGFILIFACAGLLLTVRKRTLSPFRSLAVYAVLLVFLYSLIPYKTPWLALNLWLPIALFAGLAFESLWRMTAKHPALHHSTRAVCILAGVAALALIARDTRQRVFVHPADETNPYAYAQTSEDVLGLPAEIDRLSRQHAITAPRVAVIASDPWPLPWYLRHLDEVGFWQPGQQPGKADFYITSTEAADQYKVQLQDLRPEFFGVRPGVLTILWAPASAMRPHD